MNKEMKKKYLKNPNVCPYCGSGRLEPISCWGDQPNMYWDIHCVECNRIWVDIYTLSDIEEVR